MEGGGTQIKYFLIQQEEVRQEGAKHQNNSAFVDEVLGNPNYVAKVVKDKGGIVHKPILVKKPEKIGGTGQVVEKKKEVNTEKKAASQKKGGTGQAGR